MLRKSKAHVSITVGRESVSTCSGRTSRRLGTNFGIETNRLLIQRMVAVDYAGEAVCAFPHAHKTMSLHPHLCAVLGSGAERQGDFLLPWKKLP